jgi:hypothetical protein
MPGFINKMKRKGKEAVEDVTEIFTGPQEVKELEEIVKDLLKDADEEIGQHSTPLQREEAEAVEQAIFNRILEKYDRKSSRKLERDPSSDDNDNINVYKRKLQRGLTARSGKIFAKFASEVTALNDAAAVTLRTAVESLAEFENNVKTRLPLLSGDLESEIAATFASITDQVQNSFPGGVVGIDAYDDHLPEGIPNWANFQSQYQATADSLRSLNATRIEESRAKAFEILTEAQNKVREVDSSFRARFPLLPATLDNEIDDSLATINDFVNTSFPGGLEKLDLYDDDLPDGVPSWTNLLTLAAEVSAALTVSNAEAIAADLQAKKAAIFGSFIQQAEAALAASNDSVDGLSLDYLGEEGQAAFRSSLKEQTQTAQQNLANTLA